MAPALILTRPAEANLRTARAARAAGWRGAILFSPLQEIVPVPGAALPDTGTLIVTSENGVRAAAALGPLAGRDVVAVGRRTGSVAAGYGARVETGPGDAAGLVAMLAGRSGPFVHLSGRHKTGDLAAALRAAGVAARAVEIYDQRARRATLAAGRAAGAADSVLPVFSPRSARIAGDAFGPGTRARILAISTAAAEGWPHGGVVLVARTADMVGIMAGLAALVASGPGG